MTKVFVIDGLGEVFSKVLLVEGPVAGAAGDHEDGSEGKSERKKVGTASSRYASTYIGSSLFQVEKDRANLAACFKEAGADLGDRVIRTAGRRILPEFRCSVYSDEEN
jgi:hypothetical protein